MNIPLWITTDGFSYLIMTPSSVSFTCNVTNLPIFLSLFFLSRYLPLSPDSACAVDKRLIMFSCEKHRIWKKGYNYYHITESHSWACSCEALSAKWVKRTLVTCSPLRSWNKILHKIKPLCIVSVYVCYGNKVPLNNQLCCPLSEALAPLRPPTWGLLAFKFERTSALGLRERSATGSFSGWSEGRWWRTRTRHCSAYAGAWGHSRQCDCLYSTPITRSQFLQPLQALWRSLVAHVEPQRLMGLAVVYNRLFVAVEGQRT